MSVNIYFKNHYMLIDKYIFVIPSAFLSQEVLGTWASKRGPTPPRILKLDIFSYFCKKGGKSTTDPSLEKNPSPAPMFRGTCSCIEILNGYMARESLGTPDLGECTCVSWVLQNIHVRMCQYVSDLLDTSNNLFFLEVHTLMYEKYEEK